MSTHNRAVLLAAALLLAAPASVEADGIGIGLSTTTMGQDGITNKIASGSPPASPSDPVPIIFN